MQPGLFVTFFDADEPRSRELPPVGSLEHVVARHGQLIAERFSVQQADDLGVPIDRWLEAELELQRATGEEPGGPKRQNMRVSARDGVFVRFAVFGDEHEREKTGELGPFAVVVVGPRTVEADGQVLATRAADALAPWELASAVGPDAGLRKPDIAFRTAAGTYHAWIAPTSSAAATERAFTPPPRTEPEPAHTPHSPTEPAFVLPPIEPAFRPSTDPEPLFKPGAETRTTVPPAPPPADELAALTATDLEIMRRIEGERGDATLRARIQEEQRRRLGVDEAAAAEDAASIWATRYRPQAKRGAGASGAVGGFSVGGLLWRMRFAIIAVLLIGIGAYAVLAISAGTSPNASGTQALSFVGVGSKFSGARFDWVVNGVARVSEAGTARAQGVFYVVRIGATNKGADDADLAPSDFTLSDPSGVEHDAAGLRSGIYQGPESPRSPNIWPTSFPSGKTITLSLFFDIDPSLPKGMSLAVADAPRTRVHLD